MISPERLATPTGVIAPDFTDTGYPSGGVKLTPAWQAVWDALHTTDEMTGADLVALMVAESDIAASTGYTLLTEACAAGWIYGRRPHRTAGRSRWLYRLTYAARRLEGLNHG